VTHYDFGDYILIAAAVYCAVHVAAVGIEHVWRLVKT
jgi:hypothetical protein